MKSLYVTSVERYSGKTAVCLALGKQFLADGFKVGYLKPLSLQPWLAGGKVADEDAAYVKEVLALPHDVTELSPVVVTPELLRVYLTGQGEEDLMKKVKSAARSAGAGQDILLLEGGGSLREGYVFNLPTVEVSKALDSQVLAVVMYRDEVRLIDDTLAAKFRLGDALAGVLINRVPADERDFVERIARPYIEKQGVPVFGALPEERSLAALTVEELIEVLKAEVLTQCKTCDDPVENLTVGAMTAEAALSRFRRQRNKAVITGGDRTDIQLAALETSTTVLVLTGNLRPSPFITKQADQLGVPVLLVRQNTMETVEAIDAVFGKTRLGQASKLTRFQKLVAENVNMQRMYEKLGI
ncbi:MAG: phosphotransacetylase family protein [Anaerolineales bacterium]|nr:phosphotransacetylase family protein [Anaerolineales bacterium]